MRRRPVSIFDDIRAICWQGLLEKSALPDAASLCPGLGAPTWSLGELEFEEVCMPVYEFRPRTAYPRSAPCCTASAATQAPAAEPALPRDISSRFGRRVRELRHARALTQVDLAVHFGIDRTFISDVERGRKAIGLPTMEVLALGFGISLSDLLRGI